MNFQTFLWISYGIYVLTFVVGGVFYVLYDRQRRALPVKYLGTHITLTVLTFIFFTSAMGAYAWPSSPNRAVSHGSQSSQWQSYRLHSVLRNRYRGPGQN